MYCKICGGEVTFDDWFNLICVRCKTVILPEGEYGINYR